MPKFRMTATATFKAEIDQVIEADNEKEAETKAADVMRLKKIAVLEKELELLRSGA